MRGLWLVLVFALGVAGVPAAWAGDEAPMGADADSEAILSAPGIDEPPLGDPVSGETLQTRTENLAHILRCPVCQALSVADSNSDTARAMYVRIEGFVAEGYTDEQIVDYFVDTYGEWVRLDPKAEGANLVLWLLPVGVLVVGALVIGVGSRREDEAPPDAQEVASDDPLRARVLAELGEES